MFQKNIKISLFNFFDLAVDIYKFESAAKLISKKYLLPLFSNLINQEEFAKVYLAYSNDGIHLHMDINAPFSKSSMIDSSKGDQIEIFLDSRALKSKGYLTKYSHHFIFSAEEKNGMEITKFKFDEMHPICDRKHLKADSILKPEKYTMIIKIEKEAIFGFNPIEIKNISFCYRINRYMLPSQTFFTSPKENAIEKNPYLWPKLNFK